MMDFDLNLKMKHRSVAEKHGRPRVHNWNRVLVLGATVALLAFAWLVLGVPPNQLLPGGP